MKIRTLVYALIALAAVRFLIAAVSPVFETSEARYAAISANMARTGNFLVPHFTYNDTYQSFDGKPPLLFQSAGLAARTFGVSEIAVRAPVLLASVLLVLFLGYGTTRISGSSERGLLAAALTATAVAWYALAGFCMPDSLLVVCVGAAYVAHALFLATENRTWTWAVFAALGLGMLVKGPVALVLFGMPVFFDTAFNRRWRTLARYRWFTGIPLFLLISAPWFILVERANPGSTWYFFVHENFLRFVTHNYGDKYGSGREYFRGVAALWLFVVTLPWFPWACWQAWREGRLPRTVRALRATLSDGSPANVFLWGFLGITAFWSLTSRVPIGYMIPAVPLFMAAFALTMRKESVRATLRLVPYGALLAALALAGTVGTMRYTSGHGAKPNHKMDGAAAAYRKNHYSYEFYHGTPDFARRVPSTATKAPSPCDTRD